jgi:glycosyltransferase involved in cell wall biosynthesis
VLSLSVDISVIIPAYNSERFIRKAILTCLNQRAVLFEVIVIDDNSSDRTVECVNSLKSANGNLRVICLSDNQGQSNARNVGIDNSVGKFVVFLDSDDYFYDDYVLYKWLEYAKKTDSDICKSRNYSSNDGVLKGQEGFFEDEVERRTVNNWPYILNATSCWQFMYNKKFLDNHKLRFSSKLKQREDRPFFFNCILNAKSISSTNLYSVVYSIRNDSTMRTINREQLGYFTTHLQLVCEYLGVFLKNKESADDLKVFTTQYYVNNLIEYWGPYIKTSPNISNDIVFAYLTQLSILIRICSSAKTSSCLNLIRTDNNKNNLIAIMYIRNLLLDGSLDSALAFVFSPDLSISILKSLLTNCSGDFEKGAINHFYNQSLVVNISNKSDSSHFRPRIILHVGMPKTSSSYFQKSLAYNRFSLAIEKGIYFPKAGIEDGMKYRAHRTSGHASLIDEIKDGKRTIWDTLIEETRALDSSIHTIIISSENILSPRFWDDGNIVTQLSCFLSEYEVKVVGLVREQVDWFEAMYKEAVTSNGLRYADSINSFYRDNVAQSYLQYDFMIKLFKDNFANVCFHKYSKNDAFKILLNTSSIAVRDINTLPNDKERNISESNSAVLLSRIINIYVHNKKNHDKLKSKYTNLEYRVDSAQPIWAYDKDNTRDLILETFRTSNFKLMQNHFISFDSDIIQQGNNEDLLYSANELESMVNDIVNAVKEEIFRIDMNSIEELFKYTHSFRIRLRTIFDFSFRKKLKLAEFFAKNECVDEDFYNKSYPESRLFIGGIYMHYVNNTSNKPNKLFAPTKYLELNPDVSASKLNPYYHYIKYGISENRDVD